jgi:cation diffusion facilitator family transporter
MKLVTLPNSSGTTVIIVAIFANILLMSSKIAAGVLIGSAGLVADGVHSVIDIFGAILVLVGLRVSRRPADVDHPYGHSKAEPIAELAVAFIIITTGILIIFDSATALYAQHVVSEPLIGIIVASASAVSGWGLSRYKKHVGIQIKSSALVAESKHSISDAISSLAVICGLVLAGLGYWYMDPIVGILISFVIIQIGARVAKVSIDTLMDREAASELLERIRKTVQGEPEVKQVNYIHARGGWGHKVVDVSIKVRHGISVKELSTIQGKIKAGIFEGIPEVYQVNVMTSAVTDLLIVAVSSKGVDLEAMMADDLGMCEYFVIVRFEENRIDIVGSFENLFKEVPRKKGAQIADFMQKHEVDVVITGHAGEGVVQWLRGYGIDVMIIADSAYSVRDAIKAAQLSTSQSWEENNP